MKWIKKHKKLVIILCIVLAVIVGLVFYIRKVSKEAMNTLAAMTSTEQAQVERRDLVDCVSATGTIVAKDTKIVTAKVTGVPVTEVNVAVGDYVKAGDILCRMDSTDLEAALDNAQKSLDATVASNKQSMSSVNRQLSEAKTTQSINAARNQENLNNAQAELNKATTDREAALSSYSNAIADREKSEGELGAANSALYNAEQTLLGLLTSYGYTDYDTAISDLEEKKKNTDNDEKKDKLKEKISNLKAAKKAVDQATATQVQAQAIYNAALGTEEGNRINYEAYDSAYQAQVKAYRSVAEGVEDSNRSLQSSVASIQDSVASAQISASVGNYTQEMQVENYQEQIAACTVAAPIGGVVTSVDVAVGDDYAGMNIVTIEDDSSYEITTEIDEYDISKIKVGQAVVFKTNATGDLQLDAVITSIAPKASSSSMATGSVTYTVKAEVVSKCEDLRLDMTAKMSIVISESTNVLTVPYEAVQQAEDGTFYVEVVDDGAVSVNGVVTEGRKVTVTKGIESNYYIEIISDEITEGTTILVPSAQAFDFASLLEESISYGY